MICKKEICTGCGACSNICPINCIEMKYDEEGFIYPEIDKKRCINCNKCKRICPAINNLENKNFKIPKVYGGFCKDKDILINSSSGGMFSIIAQHVITNRGVIFGAIIDENLDVFHICAKNENQCKQMRGSKYIQSEIRNSYLNVRKNLEEGKMVLFIGCPCQVAGLYSFLDKDREYENLITIDIICHGVGSTKFFRKYIEEKEKKYIDKIVNISFRDKKNGWRNFTSKITFKKRKPIYIKAIKDSFMRCYINQAIYRESCYICKYAKLPRVGDFTIGDFIGINKKIISNTDYNRGISVLLINNEKAESTYNKIKDKLVMFERPIEEVIISNKNINEPSKRPSFRNTILIEKDTVLNLQRKYCKVKYKEIIANILGYRIVGILQKIRKVIK